MGYDAQSILVAPTPAASAALGVDAGPSTDRRGRGARGGREAPGTPIPFMPAPRDHAPDPAEAEAACALVTRVRAGDAAAESDLVARYSRGLAFLLRRSTGNPAWADDLHQETFRIVIERLRGAGLDQPERLAGFIRRTARNLLLADHRRSARRRTGDLSVPENLRDPSPSPLGRLLQDERAHLVRRLVGELRTGRDREILYRYYLAEDAKEHICRDLGLSDVHFNRVLFRARQRLRELLQRVAPHNGEIAASPETVAE